MRRPSWLLLILVGAYLLPGVVLYSLIVRDMGNLYGYLDTIATAAVSAPVGLETVGLLENTIPLKNRLAWFTVLVAGQCGNVLLPRGLVCGLRLAARAVAHLVRGGNPAVPEDEERIPRIRMQPQQWHDRRSCHAHRCGKGCGRGRLRGESHEGDP